MTLVQAFARALAQLGDPNLRRPLWWSLGLAGLVFGLLWAGLAFAVAHTRLFETLWLEWAVEGLGGIAAIVLTVILFPGVVLTFLSLFLERVVEAVEARHYPGLPAPRHPPLAEVIVSGIKFLVISVVLNLFCLPLYLVPILNVVVFAALNGYLLGREYFEVVAPRRLEPATAAGLWRQRRASAFAAGAVIAIASTLPMVNLAAPVVGVAAMTHLVEDWRRGTSSAGAADRS